MTDILNGFTFVLRRVYSFSCKGSRKAQISFILLGTLLFNLIYFMCSRTPAMMCDSDGYFLAGENILAGNIDLWRTPLYPVFITICSKCFGYPASLKIIPLFQIFLLCGIFSFFILLSKK